MALYLFFRTVTSSFSNGLALRGGIIFIVTSLFIVFTTESSTSSWPPIRAATFFLAFGARAATVAVCSTPNYSIVSIIIAFL